MEPSISPCRDESLVMGELRDHLFHLTIMGVEERVFSHHCEPHPLLYNNSFGADRDTILSNASQTVS